MANIRVDLDYMLQDGAEIKFRSPVDCSQITGLIVYYPGADGNTVSKVFNLSDAHGNNVGDIDHLFAEDVVVKVILDVTKGMAFIQNADTNAYLEARINKAAPVNLLDNSDFRNPVNQRGQAKYMTGGGYTIDRWRAYHTKGNLHVSTEYSGYLKVWAENSGDATLMQRFPKGYLSEDKKYTFAYKTYEGKIVVNTTNPVVFTNENYDNVRWYLNANQTLNLVWAALYEGEYTVETLPEYRPKGYGAELAECQRYFERIGRSGDTTFFGQAFYIPSGSVGAKIFVPFTTKKRIDVPTCTVYDKSQYRLRTYHASDASSYGATSLNGISATSVESTGVMLHINFAAVSGNLIGMLQRNDGSSSAVIDISADL